MYVKSTRPSAKSEVQKEQSAKRDDQIARPKRAQTCERSELRAKRPMRTCPRRGQIFLVMLISNYIKNKYPLSEKLCADINFIHFMKQKYKIRCETYCCNIYLIY